MSLLNRKRYNAWWLYHQAQLRDGEPLPHEGTFVKCAFEVLRSKGHRPAWLPYPLKRDGISAYRWAANADEALLALGTPTADFFTLLNSWGTGYPERVHIPADVVDRLLRDGGEAGLVTDL